jgi:site-specific recombinase XerD
MELHSSLAGAIQTLIDLRRLSGSDYKGQTQLLGYFDRFLREQKWSMTHITREITDLYLERLSRLAPRSRSNRFSVVRQLCEYVARSDPHSFVPEPLRAVPSGEAHRPYIYTRSEIRMLLSAASNLPPSHSLRPHTYRTLLGLLYTTGIRIGEALALNVEHFQSAEKVLYIAEGKFRKARFVPLSPSTCQALEHYLAKRLQIGPRWPDAPLFINGRSRRLHHCTVNTTFHRLLQVCTIPRGSRIHDLRHTFAHDRLLAWYRDGQDVNARLPWLSTYMGHVDIHSTQVYLQATVELIDEVDRRFHRHYLDKLKHHGGQNETGQVDKALLQPLSPGPEGPCREYHPRLSRRR